MNLFIFFSCRMRQTWMVSMNEYGKTKHSWKLRVCWSSSLNESGWNSSFVCLIGGIKSALGYLLNIMYHRMVSKLIAIVNYSSIIMFSLLQNVTCLDISHVISRKWTPSLAIPMTNAYPISNSHLTSNRSQDKSCWNDLLKKQVVIFFGNILTFSTLQKRQFQTK